MGDISTHAAISHHVASQLRAVAPASLLPPEHYTYLELGNYLTDMSQFRDPAAHHSGRRQAHRTALRTAARSGGYVLSPITVPAAYALGLLGWNRRLFGRNAPGERHGAIAEFFRRISLAVAHQAFTQEGRDAVATSLGRRTPIPGRAAGAALARGDLVGLPPLSPAEVDRVHEAHFTQYWPHEHLDFPPVPDARDHRSHPWFADAPRRVQP